MRRWDRAAALPARCTVLLGVALFAASALRADDTPSLQPCRVGGIATEVLCGHVSRPLDPERPAGTAIDVHYVVLPAKARRKLPDPVFLFAGGPGQSAIGSASTVLPWFARLNNRRDIVFVDQRGTGRSAPLMCEDTSRLPLGEQSDADKLLQRLRECRAQLAKLPHGDLRQYTTAIAMGDVEAVRRQLGAARINLVGFSYGTRAALEVLRRFPQSVRRVVLDGVAPPDMALPASHAIDGQAALEALFSACEQEAACRARHPGLRADWQGLLKRLPIEVSFAHPLSGQPERVMLRRTMLWQAVRGPLYSSALASGLPHAIGEAAQGRMGALAGLASWLGSRKQQMAMGMHYSVVCAEDAPRVASTADTAGADLGDEIARFYEQACSMWPRGIVPAQFHDVPQSGAPVLLLSGANDPVTPPRHGERVARALGEQARHVVVPNTGHNVLALPCMRDVLFRFIDAADARDALAVDAACAARVPRPRAFEPLR